MRTSNTAAIATLISLALWAGVANTAEQSAPQKKETAARVVALADSYVARFVEAFPEQAEFSGMPLEHHDGFTDNSRNALKRWQTFYAKGDSFYKLAGQFFKENKANLKRDPVPVFQNSLKKTLIYIPNVKEVCPTNLSILRTGFEYALENAVDFFRI